MTTNTTKTKTPAKSTTKPVEPEAPAEPIAETSTQPVDSQAAASRRLSLRGYAYRLGENSFFPARDEKKAVLYFRVKTKLPGNAEEGFYDVRVFGAQAERLNRDLVHNTLVCLWGNVREVAAKDAQGNDIVKTVIFPIDFDGVTMPIAKRG